MKMGGNKHNERMLDAVWEALNGDGKSVSGCLSFTVRPLLQNNGNRRENLGTTLQRNIRGANRRFSGFCPFCHRKMQHKPKTKRTLECPYCGLEVTPKWKRTKW